MGNPEAELRGILLIKKGTLCFAAQWFPGRSVSRAQGGCSRYQEYCSLYSRLSQIKLFAGTLFRSLLRCAFLPTTGSNFTQFANSSHCSGTQTVRIVLLPVGRQVGTFFLAEWATQKCSKSRLAKSSSGSWFQAKMFQHPAAGGTRFRDTF